jgi:hypothetical protein
MNAFVRAAVVERGAVRREVRFDPKRAKGLRHAPVLFSPWPTARKMANIGKQRISFPHWGIAARLNLVQAERA